MRGRVRAMTIGLLAGGVVLTGSPAFATPATDPVSLVVGLRTPTDVVSSLERHTGVDVVASRPQTGAVTVDVPADQAGEATDALRADPSVSYVEPDHVAHVTTVTPDDPSYADQWGIAETRVNTAWDSTTGSPNVIVAVIDTGVAALPDLADRLLPGKDFVNNDSDASDDNGHGTMTAGVIAAAGGNRVGIAGICWSCRILPVKVLDSSGSGTYSDIAAGIRYAADAGADIINLSLGGSADGQVLRDAVAYAVGKGSMVIAAAGNDGSSAPHYPAAIPEVLAVGGSTAGDGRYPWSNYGSSWVDIAAPGCNPAQQSSGVVGQFCGTSSATPVTSGVAALLASAIPRPSAATIRAALMSSAHRLAGDWVADSSGRVDAAAALDKLPFWVSGVTDGQIVGGSVTVTPHAGSTSGITAVTARINGVVAATATAAPWTLTLDTRHVAGTATLTVTATGTGGTLKGVATLSLGGDHVAPQTSFRILPSVMSPAPIRGLVLIGARASDDVGVARVQLFAGSRLIGTDTTSPYAFGWQSAAYNGPVTLTLRAYDRAGNLTIARSVVTTDNTAPAVVVTKAAANGAKHIGSVQYVTAAAGDRYGVRMVELLVNGKVAQAYAGRSVRFRMLTAKYGRTIRVQVRGYDTAGNVRYTPARTWYR